MKKLLVVVAVVAIGLVGYLLMRMRPADEARIARSIQKGRAAIETEDIDKLMSVVALTYRDEYGITYALLRRSFGDMFRSFDNIKVSCPVREVRIDGDTARVAVALSVSGTVDGQRYQVIGTGRESAKMDIILIRGELSWKVIASKWEYFPSIETLLERQQYYQGGHAR